MPLAIRIHQKFHEPRPNSPRKNPSPIERIADSITDAAEAVIGFLRGGLSMADDKKNDNQNPTGRERRSSAGTRRKKEKREKDTK